MKQHHIPLKIGSNQFKVKPIQFVNKGTSESVNHSFLALQRKYCSLLVPSFKETLHKKYKKWTVHFAIK